MQQSDLSCRFFHVRLHQPTRGIAVHVHAPLLHPLRQRLLTLAGMFGQELGHVKADTTGADHRHFFAHLGLATQDIHVGKHFGMINTGNARGSRQHPGSNNDFVKALGLQIGHVHSRIKLQGDAGVFDPLAEVTDGVVEFFLAGDHLGHVELATDFAGLIKQGHIMAPLCRHRGTGQSRRAGTHHRHLLRLGSAQVEQLGFVTGSGVDQTGRPLELESVVQTGLVTGDTGIDLVRFALLGFLHELRVRQQLAGHGHGIRLATLENLFRHIRIVDAVGRYHRNGNHFLHLAGRLHEGCPWHGGNDGGHPGFVPADTGIQQTGAGRFQLPGQIQHFLTGGPFRDQINHRHAEHDDEIITTAFAGFAHDFHRETAAVFRIATVLVLALVGARRGELVNQVAFGAHDFHAIVTGLLGQVGRVGKILHRLLHLFGGHGLGLERIDRALDGRGRAGERVVTVTAGMKHLQGNLAPFPMYRIGDLTVVHHIKAAVEKPGERIKPALLVRVETTSDNKTNATAGTLGKIGCQLGKLPETVFQSGMHGPHNHPVLELGVAQIQGGKQVGIAVGCHGVCSVSSPKMATR